MIIGPTRTGKGTLLTAIKYNNLKYCKRKDLKKQNIQACQATLLAPFHINGEDVIQNDIISHSHNSHTLQPKIPFESPYHKDFSQLDKYHLVDFPGIFEQRGPDLDISIHLSL